MKMEVCGFGAPVGTVYAVIQDNQRVDQQNKDKRGRIREAQMEKHLPFQGLQS